MIARRAIPISPNKARLSRRRFISISAAAAGMALCPAAYGAGAFTASEDVGRHLKIWRGVALGADAMLQLNHPDPDKADRMIEACIAEVSRLERIFSLYREDSALCRLNREGRLDDPPVELVELLGRSNEFSRLSGGAFDVTVQPLWQLYAAHFSAPAPDPSGPSKAAIEAALERIGHHALNVDSARISIARAGMCVTLNGIAQGYITDRIVDLLRQHGIDRSLVDMGEIRAIGPRPSGEPWIVGLEDPRAPGHVAEQVGIVNQAVATSGGYGAQFDSAGRFNHIFDPATGGTSSRYLSVSVVAPLATTADALSTAFSLMPLDRTGPIARQLGINAYFVSPEGSRLSQIAA